MKAFHNDPELKQQLIDMAAEHRQADEYIKGAYGEEIDGKFRGCSIGCTIRDINKIHGKNLPINNHTALSEELGIPEFILRFQDSIYERLPEPLNTEWTERLFNAIPLGKDLTQVLPRFLIKTLDRLPETKRPDVLAAIKQLRSVLHGWANKSIVDVAAARSAAWDAAEAPADASDASEALWVSEAAKAAALAADAVAWASVRSEARSALRATAETAWAAAETAWAAADASDASEAADAAAWAADAVAWAAADSAGEAAEHAVRSAALASKAAVRPAAWEQIANDFLDCISEESQ